MNKQGLVLSDLHVGSAYGLHPPDFTDNMGNPHGQNEGQKYLWGIYQHFLNRVVNRPIDFIVFNGDILDGPQKKNCGIPLTLHRLDDQREAARIVLEEVKKRFPNAKYYFIDGTPYHEVMEEIKQVALNLLGPDHFKGRPVTQKTLRLGVGKATIQFHHEVGFSGGFTKAANLEKELLFDLLAYADHDWKRSDALIRSHCHYFRYLGRGNRMALITPCWQLQTDFVTKGSPTRTIPDLGGIVLSVDDSLIDNNICPVGFTEYLYKSPAPAITELESELEADETATCVL